MRPPSIQQKTEIIQFGARNNESRTIEATKRDASEEKLDKRSNSFGKEMINSGFHSRHRFYDYIQQQNGKKLRILYPSYKQISKHSSMANISS